MPVIIFAINSCFFSIIDSYGLGQKTHIFYFCSFSYSEVIKIIYTIFAIAIEDLKIYLGNSNRLFRKITIWFKLLTYKKRTDKQKAGALYYKYSKFVSKEYMLVLKKPGPKPYFHNKIKLLKPSKNKLSSR